MHLYLKEIKWIPFFVCAVLLLRTCVSLFLFPAAQLLSYAVLGLCLLSFLILGVLYLKEKHITSFGALNLLYFAVLFASTLLNGMNIVSAIYMSIEVLLPLCLFALYRDQISVIIKSCGFVYSVIIYANLAIMILFPNWMYEAVRTGDAFLLGGNYNQMGSRMICAIVTSVVCVRYSKWWILNSVLVILISIFTLLIVGSMTSIANILLYSLFCLVPSLRLRKLAIMALFSVFLFFQIFIVFYGEGIHHNELAVYIIEDVLGKDITFTGRTFLWDRSLTLIGDSPIIGYGYLDKDWFTTYLHSKAIGPHDFILAQLLQGGGLLLGVYLAICVIAIKRLLKFFDSTASYILMGVFVLMFIMVMEFYHVFFIMYLLSLAYYYKEIKISFDKNHKPDIPLLRETKVDTDLG